MTTEVMLTPCRPRAMRQVRECITSGTEDAPHAVHRELTEMVHFLCNCGYSSGWLPVGDLPLPSDFIQQHTPSRELR